MWFMFAACLFMHVIGDYILQTPFMIAAKQRSYWEQEAKKMDIDGTAYRYDYIAILAVHSIAWTFCIMLPMVIYSWIMTGHIPASFISAFIWNAAIHGIVDDQKANKYVINLVEDQAIHFIQIAITIEILIALG